jgi:phosphotransferase system, enzyme I, PtsP
MLAAGHTAESSLLLTLEEVSQLVSHSHHPGETLANIVRLIQGRFQADVCSVYILERGRGELVLGATVGLRAESIGRVRMRLDEGLTGLTAQKLAAVMVGDAFTHPRFKFFPEAGEEAYHSFLGVPLIESGMLQGVLVIQTRAPRSFSPNEVRMLVAVAAQLAPLISEAQLLEQLTAATHPEPAAHHGIVGESQQTTLTGSPLSPGVGIGQAYLVNGFADRPPPREGLAPDRGVERRRLLTAMETARAELTALSQRLSALVGEDHGAILQAQLMIMQDQTIEDDLTARLAAGATAEEALYQVLDTYAAAFQKLTSPFFQERVYDIKDVFRRILWYLRDRPAHADPRADKLVLIAHEASVMELFSVDLERLAAVVVEHGASQCHAAILARALNIPMVGRIRDVVHRVRPGMLLRVDGSAGVLDLAPKAEVLVPRSAADRGLPAETGGNGGQEADAGLPRLEANINLLCEITPAVTHGIDGVGLYRTEFLFLARRTLPTEEEQVVVYRKLLDQLDGRPASIRTFDLRPDKLAQVSHFSSANSQPLDWRLVLDSPPLQKLFKDQVRAILRSATAGPARILVPLVTRSEQVAFILETLGRARTELQQEGLEFATEVPVGIMIEVAAAALMVERWAPQVDFFALGTNDLVASALGMDRDDPIGGNRDDILHPGFLGLLQQVVHWAHDAGRPVSVCGEMAGDPEGALVLAGLCVDALSVAVPQLSVARAALRVPAVCRSLSDLIPEVLRFSTGKQVRDFVRTLREPLDPTGNGVAAAKNLAD